MVKLIQSFLKEYQLENNVLLKGSFCLENCGDGVTLMIDDRLFVGVSRNDLSELLRQQVLVKLKEK